MRGALCVATRLYILYLAADESISGWEFYCKFLNPHNTTKSLKARDNPKILKEYSPLLHSEKTQYKGLSNAIINDLKCDVIIEGKSYTFKNPETKLKINKHTHTHTHTQKKRLKTHIRTRTEKK